MDNLDWNLVRSFAETGIISSALFGAIFILNVGIAIFCGTLLLIFVALEFYGLHYKFSERCKKCGHLVVPKRGRKPIHSPYVGDRYVYKCEKCGKKWSEYWSVPYL